MILIIFSMILIDFIFLLMRAKVKEHERILRTACVPDCCLIRILESNNKRRIVCKHCLCLMGSTDHTKKTSIARKKEGSTTEEIKELMSEEEEDKKEPSSKRDRQRKLKKEAAIGSEATYARMNGRVE